MELNSFWLHAKADPDHIAIIDSEGSERTAGEVLARVNRIVHGLRALGLQKGDAVATLLPNCPEMIELALACGQAGFYVTPVNAHLTAPEVAFILGDCGAKAVVTHPRFVETCRAALAEGGANIPDTARFATGDADGFRGYDALTDGQPDDTPEGRVGGFVMTYTSGTTGRPRGVRRPVGDVPPDHLAHSFTGFLQLFGIEPGKVHLVTSPLYHTAVINFCLYSLHFGHTVVVMDKWTPEGMLAKIDAHRVNTTHVVPTHFVRLLNLDDDTKARYDLSSLSHVVHSAAPCPVEVKRKMLQWFGPVVYEYYAASEGGGTTATPAQWLERPGTVGYPWPMSTIRILDEQGEELPAGTVGTVWIRMGEYKFEYHGDEEKTQKAWDKGFFTVGDAGYLDEDGYLFLVDRKADMIISGGVNIYPAEIEGALIGHPDIADVAVFGVPNDDWGEEVKAALQLREGLEGTPAVADAILEWARERIAGYKVPRSIDFHDALPRDPNGKLYKRRLRDPYWEGRDTAI